MNIFNIAAAAAKAKMTEAQRKANNGRVGRVELFGLTLCIEQPRGSLKHGARLSAHYGYIKGWKGADGAAIDCFIGPNPHESTVYVIDHYRGSQFDEHKVMFCFDAPSFASEAYRSAYGKPPKAITRCPLAQFREWLKTGDKSAPFAKDKTMKMIWKEDNPHGMTYDGLLYEIRRVDPGSLMLEPLDRQEIMDDADQVHTFDAMVVTFAKFQRNMEVFQRQMQRVPTKVQPVAMHISDPFKKNGVAQVSVTWELSDGQSITIFFHNPDRTPAKILPTDDLISWKWMLNKKDITIVVAPEKGQDLNIRMVAQRVLKLAEKNSAAFARRNANRAAKMENIEALKTEVSALETELKQKQDALAVLQQQIEDAPAVAETVPETVPEAAPEPAPVEAAPAIPSVDVGLPENEPAVPETVPEPSAEVAPVTTPQNEPVKDVEPEPVVPAVADPNEQSKFEEGQPAQSVTDTPQNAHEDTGTQESEAADVAPAEESGQNETPETEPEATMDPAKQADIDWLEARSQQPVGADDEELLDKLLDIFGRWGEEDPDINRLAIPLLQAAEGELDKSTAAILAG